MIGVYFESWADQADFNALCSVTADKVFLCFVDPNCTYKKSQGTWNGTGFSFKIDFQQVRKAIGILHAKGTKVYISVGGATYNFQYYKPQNVVDLLNDLEADGVDIDFEPLNPVASQDLLIDIIQKTKPLLGGKSLSVAGFAAGCLPPLVGDSYRGSMIKVLQQVGDKIDFINLMNYDAGKGWDYKGAYVSYKMYYSKQIFFGLEVGPQGWGDALLTLDDIKTINQYLASTDGWFVWAYFKEGNPNYNQVYKYITALNSPPPPEPPVVKPLLILCPNCHQGVIEIYSK